MPFIQEIMGKAAVKAFFYRWLERLCRFVGAIGCRIVFYGREDSIVLIKKYTEKKHRNIRAEFVSMPKWVGIIDLAETTNPDEMLVVVTARQGTVSYKPALERLPEELTEHYHGTNLMIIFPDQFGPAPDTLTFATTSHREQLSAYQEMLTGLRKITKKLKN